MSQCFVASTEVLAPLPDLRRVTSRCATASPTAHLWRSLSNFDSRREVVGKDVEVGFVTT